MKKDAERTAEGRRLPITRAQADLLLALDADVRTAQAALVAAAGKAHAAALAVLAGHGATGRVVQIDTDADPPVLVVEDD